MINGMIKHLDTRRWINRAKRTTRCGRPPEGAIAFSMQGSYLASSLPCRSDDYPLEGRA